MNTVQLNLALVPPIESVALCSALSKGPSKLQCASGIIQGASVLYPLTSITDEERSIVELALHGLIQIDDSVGTDPANPNAPFLTTDNFKNSVELQRKIAGIGLSYQANRSDNLEALLALRGFTWLAAQVVQQLAEATTGGSFGDAYHHLLAAGFQPPAGWLSMLSEVPYWHIASDNVGEISRTALAYKIAFDALLQIEAFPGTQVDQNAQPLSISSPTAVQPTLPALEPWVGDALKTLTPLEIGGYSPTPYSMQSTGVISVFRVYSSYELADLASNGLGAVGNAISLGLDTLATAFHALTFVEGGPIDPTAGSHWHPKPKTPHYGGLKPVLEQTTPDSGAAGPTGATGTTTTTGATGATGTTGAAKATPWGWIAAGVVGAAAVVGGALYLMKQKSGDAPAAAEPERAANPVEMTPELFETLLKRGPYTSVGSYPQYFVTSDGAALAFDTAWHERKKIFESIRTKSDDGWRVVGVHTNWEDTELYDDHAGRIESAYAEETAPGEPVKNSAAYKKWMKGLHRR